MGVYRCVCVVCWNSQKIFSNSNVFFPVPFEYDQHVCVSMVDGKLSKKIIIIHFMVRFIHMGQFLVFFFGNNFCFVWWYVLCFAVYRYISYINMTPPSIYKDFLFFFNGMMGVVIIPVAIKKIQRSVQFLFFTHHHQPSSSYYDHHNHIILFW